ncbi:MAG: hypothetical protein K2L06_00820 [Alistipes sp.]|nr:hypothetical protein [Alistipes sp.]
MATGNRQISRTDIFALVFFAALFIVWLCTGRPDWLRYLYLGLALLYVFVIRIVAYNCRRRREETESDRENGAQS